MRILPLPAWTARLRRNGLSASISAQIAHDAAPGPIGPLRVFGATGVTSLVGGDLVSVAGSGGGRFSTVSSGGSITVSFERDGLGDGFEEGEAVTTEVAPTVTDGASSVPARLRVTLRRPRAAPRLLGQIPDQMDFLS